MKVLLLSPPREIPQRPDFPPMGLLYISSYLKKCGFDSKVIDASNINFKKLKKILENEKYDIFGVTIWTLERKCAYRTLKLAKEINPAAFLVAGGHHASAFPEHILNLTPADAVALGPAEEAMAEIVKNISDNNRNLSLVRGLVFKYNKKIIRNEPREYIEDLDKIPFPDYDNIDLSKYNGLPEIKGPAAAIISSRGCPYGCIYCSSSRFWKRKWFYRSPENVLAELEMLDKKYGLKGFIFFDDNFVLNHNRCIEICSLINRSLPHLKWACEGSCKNVNLNILQKMKNAGCYRIDFGVESGSQKILNNIKKAITTNDIKNAFSLSHEVRILPRAYLMVGNPGENPDTIDETVKLMDEIKPYLTTSGQLLWILPDTELYEKAKAQKIINDEYWLKNNEMVYYTAEWSEKELKALRNRLMKGLARNEKSFRGMVAYYIFKMYYSSTTFRKIASFILVKFKWVFNWFFSKNG